MIATSVMDELHTSACVSLWKFVAFYSVSLSKRNPPSKNRIIVFFTFLSNSKTNDTFFILHHLLQACLSSAVLATFFRPDYYCLSCLRIQLSVSRSRLLCCYHSSWLIALSILALYNRLLIYHSLVLRTWKNYFDTTHYTNIKSPWKSIFPNSTMWTYRNFQIPPFESST